MHALSDDEQMEKLEGTVEDGFAELRADFRAIRTEMSGMQAGLRGEIGATYRLMIQLFVGLYVTMILGFAGMIVAMLTHS